MCRYTSLEPVYNSGVNPIWQIVHAHVYKRCFSAQIWQPQDRFDITANLSLYKELQCAPEKTGPKTIEKCGATWKFVLNRILFAIYVHI